MFKLQLSSFDIASSYFRFWIFALSFGLTLCLFQTTFAQTNNQFDQVERFLQNKSIDESEKVHHLKNQLKKFEDLDAFDRFLSKSEGKLSPIFYYKVKMAFNTKADSLTQLMKNGEALLNEPACNWQDSMYTYWALAAAFQSAGYHQYALTNYKNLLYLYKIHSTYDRLPRLMHEIGLVYYGQNDFKNAIMWYKKAIVEYDEGRDFLFPYQVMNNMGLAYEKIQLLDSALHYFKKVEVFISEELEDSLKGKRELFFEGLVKGNQGSVYLKMGETDKALKLLQEDLRLSDSTQKIVSSCNAKITIAKIYLEENQLQLAYQNLSLALKQASNNQFKKQLREIYFLMAQYFQKVKQYKPSNYYLTLYKQLNDTLNQAFIKKQNVDFALELALLAQENEIAMLKMEGKQKGIEIEKKHWQLTFAIGLSILLIVILAIVLINGRIKSKLNQTLIQKNQEIRKRGVQLENAVLEKDLMLKEMHHRVKNNLQLVQSLLRLQASDINDPSVKKAYEESINRLSSMSLIHQNLYMQDKYKTIEFKAYLESLVKYLEGAFQSDQKQIKLNLVAPKFDLSIDHAIPAGLIITELISNAFEHAFTNQTEGQIDIKVRRKGKNFEFEVFDNGKGLMTNFDFNQSSFGTTMVRMLVEQINGEISFDNRDGAYFKISFEDLLA
ncbi:MAG: histidine kinase dimerization/phosphoacceptor domain -containing protein [Vicingaceae bacterium]